MRLSGWPTYTWNDCFVEELPPGMIDEHAAPDDKEAFNVGLELSPADLPLLEKAT